MRHVYATQSHPNERSDAEGLNALPPTNNAKIRRSWVDAEFQLGRLFRIGRHHYRPHQPLHRRRALSPVSSLHLCLANVFVDTNAKELP